MAIIQTEIESDHGEAPNRMVFYRCLDSDGVWHSYGPIITSDSVFDAEAQKVSVAAKVEESLAAAEFERMIG